MFQKLDFEIFQIINNIANNYETLDMISKLTGGDYLIPIICYLSLIFIWFSNTDCRLRRDNHRLVLKSLFHMAFTSAFILLINQFLWRDRPFDSYDVNLLFYMPTDSSFPSNSAAGLMSLTLPLIMHKPKIGLVFLLLTLLLGISRIFIGVHYPFDIVGGYLLSFSLIPVSFFVFNILKPYIERFLNVLKLLGVS